MDDTILQHQTNMANNVSQNESIQESVPAPNKEDVAPRMRWNLSTPIDRRGACVEDAIEYYNKTFPEDKVFLQNDRPVQIDVSMDGVAKVTPLENQQIRTVLGKGASWYKVIKGVDTDVNPSRDLAEWTMYAGRRELPNVPVLEGVTNGILIDQDWRVVHTSGYDAKTKYFLTKDYVMDPVPEVPTAEQVNEAKETIWEVFKEVRYKDKDQGQNSINYQNTVFGLIAATLRPTWKGAMPLLVIKKSSPRIGGSLLAESIGICATGCRKITKVAYPDNAHEYSTRIETVIIQGIPFCSIDNVTDKYPWYNTTMLSQSTGDGTVSLRLYRQNRELIDCPAKTSFILNGINMGIVSDVCGRVVPIYLENKMIWQKEKFEVKEEELKDKAYTLYPKIVWSIATIHQHWVVKGKPEPRECNGNISAYQNLWYVVGGMMQSAGYEYVLDNLQEAQMDYNEADNEAASLLEALGKSFSSGYLFSTSELKNMIDAQYKLVNVEGKELSEDALLNVIPDDWYKLASRHQLSPVGLGNLLKEYVDRSVNGTSYILRKDGKKHGGVMKYHIENRVDN